MVTHDITEALKMSDKIVVLNKGVVEQVGSPRDVLLNPSSQYVADYISIVNKQVDFINSIKGGAH
jgi:iron(III) transport system ATP-binding protein